MRRTRLQYFHTFYVTLSVNIGFKTKKGYAGIVKYTGVFGSVQLLNIVTGLLRNKFVAILIGPFGMGLNALYFSVMTFISMASGLGVSFSAVKYLSDTDASHDKQAVEHFTGVVRSWCMITALAGMAICIVAAPFLSRHAFNGGEHTADFMLLAPAVAFMAVTGGETAILKGMKRLRTLAVIQTVTIVSSLVITLPVLWIFGTAGIIPVMVLFALASMAATLFYSYRLFPPRLKGMTSLLKEGSPMIRLGVAYTLSELVTCGAEMLVRTFLNVEAGTETLGLYNAAATITVTYAGLVFTAMDTEYYPRLSSLSRDTRAFSLAANRQTEVSLLLIAPLLTALMTVLPLLMPLLYSGEFSAVVPMTRIALLSMFFNAMKLPSAYMTLAKGDSTAFFLLESSYAAVFLVLTVAGYNLWGLEGTGMALLAAHIFDLTLISIYTRIRYHHRISGGVTAIMLMQLPPCLAVYALAFVSDGVLYWAGSIALVIISTAISVKRLVKRK